MIIKDISVDNFRNLKRVYLSPHEGINIFYGNNAQGKTNLLEALCLSATGRSFRTVSDKEMINFNKKNASLKVSVNNKAINDVIEVYLSKDAKKNIKVNQVPIGKLGDLYGRLHAVIFSPDDLALIKTGPMERRKFIDTELCQINKLYYYNLKRYYHVLKQRNCLLKTNADKDAVSVWDEQLVLYGSEIIKARRDFIDNIKIYAGAIHNDISKQERLLAVYKPNVTEDMFLTKLTKTFDKDILLKTTGTGIHKDDLLLYINDLDTRTYGSQGQQRSVCLSLKLAVMEIIKTEMDISPVLLLDDVLSELDDTRQEYLLKKTAGIQTFITAADKDAVKRIKTADKTFYVENGDISVSYG